MCCSYENVNYIGDLTVLSILSEYFPADFLKQVVSNVPVGFFLPVSIGEARHTTSRRANSNSITNGYMDMVSRPPAAHGVFFFPYPLGGLAAGLWSGFTVLACLVA